MEWENPHDKAVAWSYDMEGHATKCVERNCELVIEKTEQLYKVSNPCLDDHLLKKGRIGNGWRIVQNVLSHGLERLVLGHNW